MAQLLSETLSDWQAGVPCEKHELAYCGMCREQAKIRRTRTGELAFDSDCTVATFVEVTGAEYTEAADILREHGFRPGEGAYMPKLIEAIESVGYKVSGGTIHLSLQEAVRLSATGRTFIVDGRKGRKGHAWSITNGTQNRPYHGEFSYRIHEVTA